MRAIGPRGPCEPVPGPAGVLLIGPAGVRTVSPDYFAALYVELRDRRTHQQRAIPDRRRNRKASRRQVCRRVRDRLSEQEMWQLAKGPEHTV